MRRILAVLIFIAAWASWASAAAAASLASVTYTVQAGSFAFMVFGDSVLLSPGSSVTFTPAGGSLPYGVPCTGACGVLAFGNMTFTTTLTTNIPSFRSYTKIDSFAVNISQASVSTTSGGFPIAIRWPLQTSLYISTVTGDAVLTNGGEFYFFRIHKPLVNLGAFLILGNEVRTPVGTGGTGGSGGTGGTGGSGGTGGTGGTPSASGILGVDAAGNVIAYSNVTDFVNEQGVTIATGVPDFANALGSFAFNEKFYAVKQDGVVVEYLTSEDFANDTNGTVLGTVSNYSSYLMFLGVPVSVAIIPALGILWRLLLMTALVWGSAWAVNRRRK